MSPCYPRMLVPYLDPNRFAQFRAGIMVTVRRPSLVTSSFYRWIFPFPKYLEFKAADTLRVSESSPLPILRIVVLSKPGLTPIYWKAPDSTSRISKLLNSCFSRPCISSLHCCRTLYLPVCCQLCDSSTCCFHRRSSLFFCLHLWAIKPLSARTENDSDSNIRTSPAT
jgi:hypothetical protein